jgi:hypothetical protein
MALSIVMAMVILRIALGLFLTLPEMIVFPSRNEKGAFEI